MRQGCILINKSKHTIGWVSRKWDRKSFYSRTTRGLWERETQVPEMYNKLAENELGERQKKTSIRWHAGRKGGERRGAFVLVGEFHVEIFLSQSRSKVGENQTKIRGCCSTVKVVNKVRLYWPWICLSIPLLPSELHPVSVFVNYQPSRD